MISNKDRYIAGIRKARGEHNKWLHKIKLMISGMEVNKNAVELNQSESPFGHWLYSEAILLSTLNSKSTLLEIEALFNACYWEYHKIYNVLFNGKEGLFGSLFGNKKPSSSDLMISQNYYEELVRKSDELLNKIRIYENQVQANHEEKFDGLYPKEEITHKETPKPKEERYYRGSLISDDE
jgi:hypothetical protein